MVVRASRPIQYGYATGRIRVLETKLIGKARIYRLIESESLEQIQQVLSETIYGSKLQGLSTVEGVEAALKDELGETYRLIDESQLPQFMGRYFRFRHDFINLRLIIKSGFGRQIETEFSPLGSMSPDEIEQLIKIGSSAVLPEHLELAAREALEAYSIDQDVERIDIILDHHYFNRLLWCADGLNSKWILSYTKLLIDLANLRIAVRGRKKDIKVGQLSRHFIPNSNIGMESWVLFAAGSDREQEFLKSLPDGEIKRELAFWVPRGLSPERYDILSDAIAIKFLESAALQTVGAEPVFAYIVHKEHEIKLLRLIVTGHLSGLRPERLSERVGPPNE